MRVFLLQQLSGTMPTPDGHVEMGNRLQELTLPMDTALDLVRQGLAVVAMEYGGA